MPSFSDVRRLEASGFRNWPASSVHFDGTWAVRLTAGHKAKRLNSVNPLDPADVGNLDERIARISRRFDAYGRPLVFRISPLAGETLSRHLDTEGWLHFSESLVITANLASMEIDNARDQLPLRDIGRFLDGAMAVRKLDGSVRAGLSEIIGAIGGNAGLFLTESGNAPVSTAICVQDGDLAALFEVATAATERHKGLGRAVVKSALKWAKLRGASRAWAQVEADNAPARALYRSLGFEDAYSYHYRTPA